MGNKFEECLRTRKITKFPRIKAQVKTEINSAKEDLKDARALCKGGRFKYATIAGYYSLFHSARALLYSAGFREKAIDVYE